MAITYIDKLFIERCKKISPKIDPSIFINIYNNYQTDHLKNIKNSLKDLTSKLHEDNPNIHFYIRGRIKSKASYYNKTFLKIVENIDRLFSNKLTNEQREALINKYFFYLKGNNNTSSLYLDLHNLIMSLSLANVDPFSAFEMICKKLPEKDLEIFIKKLGETQDIFAFKLVVQDSSQTLSDCHIQSCIHSKDKDGPYKITFDNSENSICIYPSIKLDPSSDIITKDNGIRYVVINGTEFRLNEQTLLYPDNTSANNRQLKNATKDKNGKVILLRDYFMLPSGEIFYIDKIIKKSGKYFVQFNDEIRNLDDLLSKGNLRLCKNDNLTLYRASNYIEDLINKIFEKIGFKEIPGRKKDYFANEKPTGYGQAIHVSYYNVLKYYSAESQIALECLENNYHMQRKKWHSGHRCNKFYRPWCL